MGNFLDRSKLLEKEVLQIEKVVFEDGDFVYVRQMTGRERDIFESSLVKKIRDPKTGLVVSWEQTTDDFRAKIAVATVCTEDGKLVFEPRDYAALSINMSAKRLETIMEKAQALNKISDKDKEELVKNSVAVLDGDSHSDSVQN